MSKRMKIATPSKTCMYCTPKYDKGNNLLPTSHSSSEHYHGLHKPKRFFRDNVTKITISKDADTELAQNILSWMKDSAPIVVQEV